MSKNIKPFGRYYYWTPRKSKFRPWYVILEDEFVAKFEQEVIEKRGREFTVDELKELVDEWGEKIWFGLHWVSKMNETKQYTVVQS